MDRTVLGGVWLVLVVMAGSACGKDERAKSTDAGQPDADADAGEDAGDEPDADAAPPDGGPGGGVDIVRDERGVAHVFADDLQAAFYGLGWATAEDRLLQMHLRRLSMQGRLSEHFAVDEADDRDGTRRAFNQRLLKSDREVRTVGYAAYAARTVDSLPRDVPALLRAYAAGVNALMASDGFVLPPTFESAGISSVEPWTAADCLLVWEWVGRYFGNPLGAARTEIDNLLDCESGDGCTQPDCPFVVDEDAAVVPPPEDGIWPPSGEAEACWLPGWPVRPPVEIKASHGWVVHGDRVTTGRPILVAEPQLSLTAPSTWYEYHLQAGDVDVRGAGVAGSPGMFIFWNRHLSQTLTAGGGDVGDLFELTLGRTPDTYVVDDEEVAFETREERIEVRHGDPVDLTVRSTRFGPVVTRVLQGAPAGREFALRYVEQLFDDRHSVVGSIDLLRATDLVSYRAAIENWLGPPVHSLYAGVDADDPDGPGHIAYHTLGAIPVRAQNVVEDRDFTGRLPYDGSDSSQDWSDFYGIEWHPHVVDPPSGYLFSANHLAVGTWYDEHLYGGFKGVGDTYRSLQLRILLGRLFANPDSVVTPETLHALHFDAGIEIVRIYRDMLEWLDVHGQLEEPPPVGAPRTRAEKASRVLEALDLWRADGGLFAHSDARWPLVRHIVGKMTTLVRRPATSCTYNGGEGGASYLAKTFDADPDGTMTREVAAFALDVAEQAWNAANEDFELSPDPALWTVPEAAPRTIPYQSNFDCLRPGAGGSCSLDPAHDFTATLDRDFGSTLNSAGGSSFPATVDFSAIESTRALLPPGVSEVPTSPHFRDAMPNVERKADGDPESIPFAPLDRETIEENATSTLHLPYPP